MFSHHTLLEAQIPPRKFPLLSNTKALLLHSKNFVILIKHFKTLSKHCFFFSNMMLQVTIGAYTILQLDFQFLPFWKSWKIKWQYHVFLHANIHIMPVLKTGIKESAAKAKFHPYTLSTKAVFSKFPSIGNFPFDVFHRKALTFMILMERETSSILQGLCSQWDNQERCRPSSGICPMKSVPCSIPSIELQLHFLWERFTCWQSDSSVFF